MRKHFPKKISVICVILIMAIGVIVLPSLACSNPPVVEDIEGPEVETVMPGNWWKLQLDQSQTDSLQSLWHSDINAKNLLEDLCPETLQELSGEIVSVYEDTPVHWPSATFDEWQQIQCLQFGSGYRNPDTEETTVYEVYCGIQLKEETTFNYRKKDKISEDRIYRISLYTDTVMERPPGF